MKKTITLKVKSITDEETLILIIMTIIKKIIKTMITISNPRINT